MKTKILLLVMLFALALSCSNDEEALSPQSDLENSDLTLYDEVITLQNEMKSTNLTLSEEELMTFYEGLSLEINETSTKVNRSGETNRNAVMSCNDPISFYLKITWTNPLLSNAEKESVRNYFETYYGKQPEELILPGGSESWQFKPREITVPTNGECGVRTIKNTVSKHSDVDADDEN